MKIWGVPRHMVDPIWPWVEPCLVPSIRMAGTHLPIHVLEHLLAGRAQLYVQAPVTAAPPFEIAACVITELLHYPLKRVCRIWLAGSNGGADWQGFVDLLGREAKAHGYDALDAIGRRGWNRYFKGKELGPVVVKELA